MDAPNCPPHDLLEAYVLGALADRESSVLEQHLDTCVVCSATLESLDSRQDQLLFSLDFGEGPPLADSGFRRALVEIGRLARPFEQPLSSDGGNSTTALETPGADPTHIGVYRIVEPLGRGGMGCVYKAEHCHLHKMVALKILPPLKFLDPAARRRFVKEMAVLGQLDDPHIVRADHADEIDGQLVLVMELVEGLDLQKVLDQANPLPVGDACELIRQAALGLDHIHRNGVVHRDLKPSNLMLTPGGVVKILDLGLARLQKSTDESRTSPGQVMGTYDYMAPEQFNDVHEVDIRADLYSLGCALYKLLVGRAPFECPAYSGFARKMMAHQEVPVPPPGELRPGLPDAVASLLDRLLAKAPGDRLPTPAELIAALTPLAAGADLPGLYRKAAEETAGESQASPTPSLLASPHVSTAAGPLSQSPCPLPARVPPLKTRRRLLRRVALGLLPIGFLLAAYAVVIVVHWDKDGTRKETRIETNGTVHLGADGSVTLGPSNRGAVPSQPPPLPGKARLDWANLLGGTGLDEATCGTVDREGYSWIAGYTQSKTLTADGRETPGYLGNNDGFVARFEPGGRLAWAKFVGGGSDDRVSGIALDGSGRAAMVGWTRSPDFPVEPGATHPTWLGGDEDAFVTWIDVNGTFLKTARLGGRGFDRACAAAIDAEGNALVAGSTSSGDFPGLAGLAGGDLDGYVAKIAPDGKLLWATALGGSKADAGLAVAVGPDGTVFAAGQTQSPDFPVRGNHAGQFHGGKSDAFVAALSAEGQIVWSALVGGGEQESFTSVSFSPSCGLVLGGWTTSDDFPTTGGNRVGSVGGHDACVAECDLNGKLTWGSVLGGGDLDETRGTVLDEAGNLIVTGETRSTDFPVRAPMAKDLRGTSDAFVAEFSPERQLKWCSYVGGDGPDTAVALALADGGLVRIAGRSGSGDLPGPAGESADFNGCETDAWLAEIGLRAIWDVERQGEPSNGVRQVKLTPDRKHLYAFFYTGTAEARVEKLDATTGRTVDGWENRQVGLSARQDVRGTFAGWVDGEGSLYLTSGWGANAHTLWKFDAELQQESWRYQAGLASEYVNQRVRAMVTQGDVALRKKLGAELHAMGLEYINSVMTDDQGNIYAVGYVGSWFPFGSRCVKLDRNGKRLWDSHAQYGTGSDVYDTIALDSRGNLYCVGHDDHLPDPSVGYTSLGRIIGHDATTGEEFLNHTVAEPNSAIAGVVVDPRDDLPCIAYAYRSADGDLSQYRTVVQKLDRQGRVLWEYRFNIAGMVPSAKSTVRHTEKTFYVTFDCPLKGRRNPGIVEMTFDGRVLWTATLDAPGWVLGPCSPEPGNGMLYLGLSNVQDPTQSRILALSAPCVTP